MTAPPWPDPDPQDVASPAALLRAWDASLSFAPGAFPPDGERLRSLFLPSASVASASADDGAGAWLDPTGFVAFVQRGLRELGWDRSGFGERNRLVRQETVGRIHALTTTFTVHVPAASDEPTAHGVNLFHLVEVDGRLAIASYAWHDLDEPWRPGAPQAVR